MKECAPPIRIVASVCHRTGLFSVTATGRWVLLLQKNSLFYPKETTCPFTFSNFSQAGLQRWNDRRNPSGITGRVGCFACLFEQAGILIARPAGETSCRLAISAKGGTNAENHNHNDVGSYAVALGSETMVGDQGGPNSYPGDYFNGDAPQKYKIKGSFVIRFL